MKVKLHSNSQKFFVDLSRFCFYPTYIEMGNIYMANRNSYKVHF